MNLPNLITTARILLVPFTGKNFVIPALVAGTHGNANLAAPVSARWVAAINAAMTNEGNCRTTMR